VGPGGAAVDGDEEDLAGFDHDGGEAGSGSAEAGAARGEDGAAYGGYGERPPLDAAAAAELQRHLETLANASPTNGGGAGGGGGTAVGASGAGAGAGVASDANSTLNPFG
jgi:hypothetical protein